MSELPEAEVLERIYRVIAGRKGADPAESYTAKLYAGGTSYIAKKLSEESAEVVIAALVEGEEDVARESADLIYHLMVLWAEMGVEPADVWKVMAKREGVSGLMEKASRDRS